MVFMCHMLEYARAADGMVAGRTRADLDTDIMLRLAVTRAIEVIGEAAAHVPPGTRSQHPQLPWQIIVGMRHRLIHGYAELDLDLLWEAASADVPKLITELQQIVPPELLARGEEEGP
jgi:uncharacterized protein with HEPN domain